LKIRQLILLCGISLILAACGGGGGGGDAGGGGGSFTPQTQSSFGLTGTLDGAAIPGAIFVSPGQSFTTSMKSGQNIKFSSSGDVNWKYTGNGSVSSIKTISSKVWDYVVNAPAGATTLTLVASAISDTSKVATITVAISAQEFDRPVAPTLGATSVYGGTNTLVDSSSQSSVFTNTVATIASDNSFTRTRTTSINGAVNRVIIQSISPTGARISNQFSSSLSPLAFNTACTFTPALAGYSFPLFVGKTYNSSSVYACGAGYTDNRSYSGKVLAYEQITVPAGTFNALKVELTLTNSNQPAPVSGTTRVDSICWVDTVTIRELKCNSSYTYTQNAGAPQAIPNDYLSTETYTLR
jgi:hypothetical protein